MVEDEDALPKHLDGKRVVLPAHPGRQLPLVHRKMSMRRAHRPVAQPVAVEPALVKVLGCHLEAGLASGDVILTVLARQRQPVTPPSITTPDTLRLKIEPAANCGRYDSIRKVA